MVTRPIDLEGQIVMCCGFWPAWLVNVWKEEGFRLTLVHENGVGNLMTSPSISPVASDVELTQLSQSTHSPCHLSLLQ